MRATYSAIHAVLAELDDVVDARKALSHAQKTLDEVGVDTVVPQPDDLVGVQPRASLSPASPSM